MFINELDAVMIHMFLALGFIGLAPLQGGDDLGHGGGCRKSSPPGQCCHMQTSVGKVHCH
jgi:hypothetical protein